MENWTLRSKCGILPCACEQRIAAIACTALVCYERGYTVEATRFWN